MSDVVFVDTNILIYAHDVDAGAKRSRAAEKLRQLWESGAGRLSVQVLQEFYVNVTQKLATPVARSTAREVVSSYGAWIREPTTAGTGTRGVEIFRTEKGGGGEGGEIRGGPDPLKKKKPSVQVDACSMRTA